MDTTDTLDFDELVNRLAREVAQAQRQAALAQQKLTSTTRSLEIRTQELAECRAALALLHATLDASQDGILAVGYFGRAMHCNARFASMWGIPEDKVGLLNDAALLAIQMSQVKNPERLLAISQVRRAQPGEERTDLIEMADGRLFECQVQPHRVRGRRVGTVTYWRDVTQRERLDRIVTLLESEIPERVAEARATTF
jgi:PAS domain S-box-containing protein